MTLLYDIAKAYMALCSFKCKQSIKFFNSLSYHHYNTSWILCQVGKAFYESCQFRKAAAVFANVRKLDPYKVEDMDIYSTTLWHLHKESDLAYLTHEMIDISRQCPQTWCVAGNCFSLQKEHDDAIKFFQRALQVDPSFAYAYTLLGHEYSLIGELDKSQKLFKDAVYADSRHYHAWYGMGMIYYKQEKFDWAEVRFKQAFAINPSSSILLCHIGLAQHAQNRSDEALTTMESAIKLDPNNILCQYHHAAMLYAIGEYEKALSGLEKLKKTASRESLVYYMIGKIYDKLNQPHLAFMNYSEASHLDPKGQNNAIKEEINRQYLNERNDNGANDNGIGVLDAVLEQDPDNDNSNFSETDEAE
ncbi:uncharacterized protein TRIADDRAFT_21924 [Trichoplax adhaerens]|uniref:Cell division cycle protein 27 homolog n=1 Tax=Trichoplax adhaerens TaxID=10228 RepID=B3RRI2_TRIAD|nr:hypothetical protein TRIADDRAFT_21924 [Trichoplax adhaerens]EDV26349.1 hypothetical protein TRIADDRAFT_21924 [Trichoplax adhaerens]|eukprot:XP_002110345.1 hypothetical protein TRIADDRAFT_21924 [Trichoplax adhaerens]